MSERLPFHEWVVQAVKTATLTELFTYGRICKGIKIPEGHDLIKEAIQKRLTEVEPNHAMVDVIEDLDLQKTEVAAEQARKVVEAEVKAAAGEPVEA